jgi:hypothetical protein
MHNSVSKLTIQEHHIVANRNTYEQRIREIN